MRKTQDDVMARSVAESQMADLLTDQCGVAPDDHEAAKALVGHFKAVEFERGTSKDPDKQVVPMRRVVLTGPWEVDPDGVVAK